MGQRKRRQSFFFDKIGYFNPHKHCRLLYLDSFKLASWLTKGALLHKTVKKYLVKYLVK